MKTTKILLAISVILAAPGASAFDENPGGEADSFLSWGLGARAEGMGRAFGPIADDASAAYWNPAGLYQLEKGEVTFSSAHPFQDVHDIYYHTLNLAYPMNYTVGAGKRGSFGTLDIGLAYARVGGIWEADEKGLTGRRFADTDIAFYLSYAHSAGENGGFGFTLKNVNRRIADHGDNGFGLDLGGLYRPVSMLSVSLVIRDLIAPNFKFEAVREAPPLTFEVGTAAYVASYAKLAVVSEITREGYYDAYAGAEVTPISAITVRGGWSLGDGAPRFGVGIRFLDFDFNYALRLDDTLGDTHLASISLYFGGAAEPSEDWDEWEDISDEELEELLDEEGYIEFEEEEVDETEETEGND